MKLIKKIAPLLLVFVLVCVTSVTAFADSVNDVNSPDDRWLIFGSINRFSHVYLDTSNVDATTSRWIFSTDSRYGLFDPEVTHNQDLVITNIDGTNVSTHSIETFVTRYVPDSSRNYNRLVFGFMRDWCARYLSRATVATIYYPTMYYATGYTTGVASVHTGFDYVLAGTNEGGNITATFTATLCTKNRTTGVVTRKPINKTATTSGAINFTLWEETDVYSYVPNYNGGYWLEDCRCTLVMPSGVRYLQIGGTALYDVPNSTDRYTLSNFNHYVDGVRDADPDAHNFDFGWLLDGVQAFLNFEILPDFKLYGVLMAIAGFGLFMWFLKMFAGG